MTSIVIVFCLILIASIIASGMCIQYRRYSERYKKVAHALFDDGSWRLSFYLRTLLVKGTIGGRTVRYGVLGDDRGNQPVSSYLFLEYPVKRNFRFYAASDPDLVDPDIRKNLGSLQQELGFCGLTVISRDTPFLGKFLARPLGFGYQPGLLLWKFGGVAFDNDVIRRDILLLLQVAEEGI